MEVTRLASLTVVALTLACADTSAQDAQAIVGTWALGTKYAPAATTGYTEQLIFESDGKLIIKTIAPLSQRSTATMTTTGQWEITRKKLYTVVTFDAVGERQTIREVTAYELEGDRLWLHSTQKTYWRIRE